MEFARQFPDDETCLRFLWDTRYNLGGDEAHCQRCEEIRLFRRYEGKQQRQAWTCTACGYQLYPTAGTIFHKSSTALHLWFHAMYLMTSTRCGISAKQLERELGVTYKTAWRMFTLIRNELMTQDDNPPLSGVVEMDETYVGGKPRAEDRREFAKARNYQSAAVKWGIDNKVQVFGAVERNRRQWLHEDPRPTVTRHGKVTAHVIPSRQKDTLMGHVARRVDPESVVYTDAAHAYTTVPARKHATVDHHRRRVRPRRRVHPDHRWVLVSREAGDRRHASRRLPQVAPGILERVRLAVQPPRRPRAMFALLLLRSANPIR